MIQIQVNGNLERALKGLKKKFNDLKIVKELRERNEFTSKSEMRRDEIGRAKYIENKRED
jgi:small subunit ribosomal protein S21